MFWVEGRNFRKSFEGLWLRLSSYINKNKTVGFWKGSKYGCVAGVISKMELPNRSLMESKRKNKM